MADNYLESHYDEWLKKKAAWEKKGKPKPKQPGKVDNHPVNK